MPKRHRTAAANGSSLNASVSSDAIARAVKRLSAVGTTQLRSRAWPRSDARSGILLRVHTSASPFLATRK